MIAKDNDLFGAAGIDMEFVRTLPNGPVAHTENPEEVTPNLLHTVLKEVQMKIYRA